MTRLRGPYPRLWFGEPAQLEINFGSFEEGQHPLPRLYSHVTVDSHGCGEEKVPQTQHVSCDPPSFPIWLFEPGCPMATTEHGEWHQQTIQTKIIYSPASLQWQLTTHDNMITSVRHGAILASGDRLSDELAQDSATAQRRGVQDEDVGKSRRIRAAANEEASERGINYKQVRRTQSSIAAHAWLVIFWCKQAPKKLKEKKTKTKNDELIVKNRTQIKKRSTHDTPKRFQDERGRDGDRGKKNLSSFLVATTVSKK